MENMNIRTVVRIFFCYGQKNTQSIDDSIPQKEYK